ncbi:MAG: hypothetical protein IJR96_06515 [Pseudobutyrivibrio sp.]|nr:hypothetical protein [Pseudobutyrivibrio sp.]
MFRFENRNRILAMVAIFATVFVMLFSVSFSSRHVSHHCDDEANCPVCCMLTQCQQAIKSIGAGLIIVAAFMAIVHDVSEAIFNNEFQSVQTTLVSQKVRLDS